MKDHKQLFHCIQNVEVHDFFNPILFDKGPPIPKSMHSTMFTFTWPNGSPCVLIEMYLQSKSSEKVENDPGSSPLKPVAVNLSHFARFAWAIQKDFWEITDHDFDDFIFVLMQEKKPNFPSEPKRNNNTVKLIVDSALDFVQWLQDKVFIGINMIGMIGEKSNIHLQSKRYIDWGGKHRVTTELPSLPPRATKRPKSPISREVKNSLWAAVTDLTDFKNRSRRYLNRFDSEQDALEELLYLKKRRELVLQLLEVTGARPGELSLMQVSRNENCIKDKEIILRTLKRRSVIERAIPIPTSVAFNLDTFIKRYRERLLQHTNGAGKPMGHVFLTTMGSPLSKGSMTRDFSRIVDAAHLESAEACMSMFRHRFITNMVILHLKQFMKETNGKLRATLNLADYRTILKRVAVFTGHGSEESLLHYIDLAWEEMGLFDYVEPTFNAISKAEGLIQELTSIVTTEKLSLQILRGGVNSGDLLKALENFILDHTVAYETLKSVKRDRQFPDGIDAKDDD